MTTSASVTGGFWLTEQRVVRLGRLTLALRTRGGWARSDANRRGWTACGGPLGEMDRLLDLLFETGLISQRDNRITLTKAGDSVALAERRSDRSRLAFVLIRGGFLFDQARNLLEAGTRNTDGSLQFNPSHARGLAPQLVGLLAVLPGVRVRPTIHLPTDVVAELSAAWALLPTSQIPTWAQERKQVGDRAEYYSWLLERSTGEAHVFWVAQDRDDYGYDIENRASDPPRRIEVKGRRDNDVVFYLSDNEWAKAEQYGNRYEVQFWGDIDLRRTPQLEYASLRAQGWPFIVANPFTQLQSAEWEMRPIRWRVRPASRASVAHE